MAQVKSKPPDTGAMANELLRFEIDKTQQSLFEAGKALGTAFLTYLSLLSLTALLIYGKSVEDNVSVPLLTLKLNKDLAAAITLLLCQVVQIWVISLLLMTSSLTDLLCSKLKERYERVTREAWYLQYPSPFHSIQFLIDSLPGKQSTLYGWLIYTTYSIVVAFVPYYLSTVIGRRPNFPPALKTPWILTNTMLNFSVMTAMVGTAIYIWRSGREVVVRPRTKMLSELQELNDKATQLEELLREVQSKQEADSKSEEL
jgi:hypothetical protein